MRESTFYQYILEEGKQEGEQQKAEKVSLKMLQAGMPIEQIAQFTDLSIESIKTLQKNANIKKF